MKTPDDGRMVRRWVSDKPFSAFAAADRQLRLLVLGT